MGADIAEEDHLVLDISETGVFHCCLELFCVEKSLGALGQILVGGGFAKDSADKRHDRVEGES